jgi:putative membrane protein
LSTTDSSGHVSDHLANERTYLAWLRTGVAIIALGFVVAKFGLIVSELSGGAATITTTSFHLSAIVGIALVVAGGLLDILALRRFKLNQERIKIGRFEPSSGTEMVVSASIFIIAILLVVYLVLTV